MSNASGGDLTILAAANHTLIKSLIALLAMKDDHLLDEMRTVFSAAHRAHRGISVESEATLALARRALEEIAGVVEQGVNERAH